MQTKALIVHLHLICDRLEPTSFSHLMLRVTSLPSLTKMDLPSRVLFLQAPSKFYREFTDPHPVFNQ
ncbi:hypothetical protein ACMX2M_25800 [Paenibacillus polymyxa]|uniref:hypothetical protein n=1 Tax=Paenibacillus TaxID=44249 RepID=UPI0010599D6E|nr:MULTISPECIES: hypothetical protein [Paenibacillus]MCL6662948.1 hypothetical protein [Paenibacillus amylolyticus]TDL65624.1 hypothetical protein E2R58_19365 [Paenibacillus amylolyticus]UOK63567.1 hypothetical protein MT997_01920 [Paenibacillus sp. OVF10]